MTWLPHSGVVDDSFDEVDDGEVLPLLLAEELALLAIDPDRGRAQLGERSLVNATLAGLLIAELVIDGLLAPGTELIRTAAVDPADPLLSAALRVVQDRGPKVKAVLSAMDRGLDRELGRGTWDAVVDRLIGRGILGPGAGTFVSRHVLVASATRDALLDRLRAAASGDEPLDVRTAAVLSMTGPGHLLELVAPDRSSRKHARHRIDHCLDETEIAGVGLLVRKVLQDAAAAAAAGAVTATIAATS